MPFASACTRDDLRFHPPRVEDDTRVLISYRVSEITNSRLDLDGRSCVLSLFPRPLLRDAPEATQASCPFETPRLSAGKLLRRPPILHLVWVTEAYKFR